MDASSCYSNLRRGDSELSLPLHGNNRINLHPGADGNLHFNDSNHNLYGYQHRERIDLCVCGDSTLRLSRRAVLESVKCLYLGLQRTDVWDRNGIIVDAASASGNDGC